MTRKGAIAKGTFLLSAAVRAAAVVVTDWLPESATLLNEITAELRPIAAPRAGDVLGVVVKLLPGRSDWTVKELKQEVEAEGVEASPKEIYNALGYLNRKGHIRRIGYGRYLVDGAELVTAEDLGGRTHGMKTVTGNPANERTAHLGLPHGRRLL